MKTFKKILEKKLFMNSLKILTNFITTKQTIMKLL